MKRLVRLAGAFLFVLALLIANAVPVHAQDVTAVFTAPPGTLPVGGHASLWLYCMNNSSNSVRRTFAPSLNCTLSSLAVTLETELHLNTKSSPSAVTIPPGGFVKEEYLLEIPITSSGQATLDISGYNPVTIVVEQGVVSEVVALPETPHASTSAVTNADLREYFANHVSFYEPIYFIAAALRTSSFNLA